MRVSSFLSLLSLCAVACHRPHPGKDGEETGAVDTAPGDTGSGDTGSGDTGSGDTGSGDTGSGDTGGSGSGTYSLAVDGGVCPGAPASCFGQTALAVDTNHHTYVAFGVDDPDGDGTYDDGAVQIVASDDAGGWTAPMTLGSLTELGARYNTQVAIAVDPVDDNLLAVTWYDSASGDIYVATSTNAGHAWTTDRVVHGTGSNVSELAIDVRAGATMVVAAGSGFSTGGALLQRPAIGASWTTTNLPLTPSTGPAGDSVGAMGVSARLRPSDRAPFAGYFLTPSSGYDVRFVTWTPDAAQPVVAFDSNGTQNDFAESGMDFDGDTLWAGAILLVDTVQNAWINHSDDGATWGEALPIPSDGGDTYGGRLGVAAEGGVVTTAIDVGGGTGEHACGQPKVASTADGGATFSLCGVMAAPDAAVGSYSDIVASFDGRRQVTFISTGRYGSVAPGIIVWSE